MAGLQILNLTILVRVQASQPIFSFVPFDQQIERLNVSNRKTSAVEGRVRYQCFEQSRLFGRIMPNEQIMGVFREF